jgi:diguanylate cyclase (GGDEF)-like protein
MGIQAFLRSAKEVFTKTLPGKMGQEFEEERAAQVVRIGRYLAAIVMVIELLNMYMMAFVRKGGLSVFSHKVYFVLYILLFAISFAGFLLSFLFGGSIKKYAKISLTVAAIEGALFCLWGTAVSLYDQRVTENVSVYLCIVLSISVFLSFRPWQAVLIFGVNQMLLMIFFSTFQPVPTNNMGNYTNTACATIMAVLISIMRYNSSLEAFRSRKIIVSQKEQIERMNEELHVQVVTDELTKLFNRRYLKEVIPVFWERYREAKIRMTAVMIDIDNFKVFNDTYGHQAGDECIAAVAGLLKEELEMPDSHLIRYGGEEFLLLAAGQNRNCVQHRVNQARVKLEEKKIRNEKAVFPFVTISAGVYSLSMNKSTQLDECIQKADLLLYKSKQNGKNQIMAEEEGV